MDFRINGRECPQHRFTFALERLGVGGIDITLLSEAESMILNSVVDELKDSIGKVIKSSFFSHQKAMTYINAMDLLYAALHFLKQKYEDDTRSTRRPFVCDDQLQLAGMQI